MESLDKPFAHGVSGIVKPGYEPVLKAFENNFYNEWDTKAQLCVFVGEECVVDLIGTSVWAYKKSKEMVTRDHL